MKFFTAFILITMLWTGVSCSSKPKTPVEVFTLRNVAANQLDMAHQMANRGRYGEALLILADVQKTVVGVDDPPLIIRTGIVYGNVLFSMGRSDEAFAYWESALAAADREGELKLAALVRIYNARGRVVLLSAEGSGTAGPEITRIRDQMDREIALLKGDDLGIAAGWVTAGLAEKELRRYTEAENSVRKALAIHEKNNYLEDTAYDWFLIASIRSVAGRTDGAIEALNTAIRYDRRAENGFGLASSWQALGDVHTKRGNAAEAQAAYRRAADIYRALGLEDHAQRTDERMNP